MDWKEYNRTLIVGQGLAGTILAWTLISRGENCLIIDDKGPGAASPVAAGMINPLAGKRFALYPGTSCLLESAIETYRGLAEHFEQVFFHPLPIHRFFQNDKEAARHAERLQDPGYAEYMGPKITKNALDGFITLGGGWVNIPHLLEVLRTWFQAEGRLSEESFSYDDLQITEGGVRWKSIEAKRIVFCEGWRVNKNPWFSQLPWDPVKGEILTVESIEDEFGAIYNRGKWLVPAGEGRMRAGATYSRDSLNDEVSQDGFEEICKSLEAIQPLNRQNVLAHQAGIRPGTKTQHPIMGRHPEQESLYIFNGFGSKGSLLIPELGKRLCDSMLKGIPLSKLHDLRCRWTS